MSFERVPLAGGWIDRDANTRASDEALAAAWGEPTARVLLLHGTTVPLWQDTTELALIATSDALIDALETTAGEQSPPERLYLGRRDGNAIFALGVMTEPIVSGADWRALFEVAMQLDPAERELVVMATALVRWHENEQFLPRDGAATSVADGGWSRRTADGVELFPRTDPAVIVLIEHEGKVLLGSNALWESGRFSLLAGFVEAGESLEEAVAREVFEESGVRVDNIRYVASQPWPFPRSLMLGFHASLAADHDPSDLVPAPDEISELRWFTPDEVLSPPPGVKLPGTLSIAGWLLTRWAEGAAQ